MRRLWRLRVLPLGCCVLSITVSSPEVGGTDQTLTRVWTGRRRKWRLCRGSREAGHSCSGDPHLFCSRGLAAPREWVQEAEGPEPMLGCQVAWCQGDVWRRMGRGKEVGRRERWLPQPRRRGWQGVVSVVLRHRGGGRGGEEGARRAEALAFLYTSGHLRTGEVGTWDRSSPTESRALASPPQSSPAHDPVVLRLRGLWVVCAQGADVF